jgi:multimeric flavodoxin WrbA
MTRILAINGSYRDDGITDQAVETMAQALRAAGAEVEIVLLRDYPIEFCLNCRECTQQPGDAPGECVQHDGMQALVNRIEQADGYILASPTNFGSVTALYKRFMERLVVYAYWPWERNTPQFRKANAVGKKALLVSSCAAPGILGRWFYSTLKQLRMSAKTIGARPVGTLFIGLIATQTHARLPKRVQKKVQALAAKLL